MKYTVQVEGRSFEVEVNGEQVSVNGRPVVARLGGRTSEPVRRLVRDRESRQLQAVRGEGRGAWTVVSDGARIAARVLDARDLAIQQAGTKRGAASGSGKLKAPMPGMVIRVLVEEGHSVVAGQGLVVVEAMKMENQLKASGPGVVGKIHVTPGTRVEKGTMLLEVTYS